MERHPCSCIDRTLDLGLISWPCTGYFHCDWWWNPFYSHLCSSMYRSYQFLAKGKATSTGKLLDSLLRNNVLAESRVKTTDTTTGYYMGVILWWAVYHKLLSWESIQLYTNNVGSYLTLAIHSIKIRLSCYPHFIIIIPG
jgi:hypothetical protein